MDTSPDTSTVVTVVGVFCLVEGHVHLIHQEHMELTEECLKLLRVSEGLSSQHLLPYNFHHRVLRNTQGHANSKSKWKERFHYVSFIS